MATNRAAASHTQSQQRQSRFSMATGGPNRPSFSSANQMPAGDEGDIPAQRRGTFSREKLKQKWSLVQAFISDLFKARENRTLSPEETTIARNYVIMLLGLVFAVYYVVTWLLRIVPMVIGLIATFYVLFLVVKGRPLTIEEIKAYLPEFCHEPIDNAVRNVKRVTGRSQSIAHQGQMDDE